jgi:hypothetical protein
MQQTFDSRIFQVELCEERCGLAQTAAGSETFASAWI